MELAPVLVRPWDYGWLCRDWVDLAGAQSDTALIEQYVASPVFHTSFLPNDKDETGIHGPFVADRITAADFVPLRDAELAHYLESVRISESPSDDAVEIAKVLPALHAAFEGRRRCFVLSRDERNHELFHEWGLSYWSLPRVLVRGVPSATGSRGSLSATTSTLDQPLIAGSICACAPTSIRYFIEW